MNRILRNTGFYLIIFLVLIGIIHFFTNQNPTQREMSYNEFLAELENDNIAEVTLRFDGYTYYIKGKTTQIDPETNNTNFTAFAPYDQSVVERIETRPNVTLNVDRMERDSIWLTLLTSLIPFVIIFILFFFLFNQAQGGGGKVMNFGKSRARLYNEEKKRSDV